MTEYVIDPAAPQTEKQRGYLHIVLREHGWREDDRDGCIEEMFGSLFDVDALSRLMLSQLIDRIVTGPKWVDSRQQRLPL